MFEGKRRRGAPTKKVVLIGPEYAVWSPGETHDDFLRNWYYDDVSAVGGYNHFELRRQRRAYTLPNPAGGNYFTKGVDTADPMAEAATWLQDFVFQSN
jgi:hypothetical protein